MRSSLIALISIAFFVTVGRAGETTVSFGGHPLTITDAVQLALRQSPTLLNQVQELKRNKGLVFEAQASMVPQVTGSANYSQEDPGLLSTGGGKVPFDLLALPAGAPLKTTNLVAIPISQLTSGTTANASWLVKVTVS